MKNFDYLFFCFLWHFFESPWPDVWSEGITGFFLELRCIVVEPDIIGKICT